MNRLQKSLGIAALVLAFAGCTSQTPEKPKTENLREEYLPKKMEAKNIEPVSQLKGEIIKVQSSSLSYRGRSDSTYLGHEVFSSSNHEFEYVIIRTTMTMDGWGLAWPPKVLIYPYSKAILEKQEATIQYIPLKSGSIDAETFIDIYLNPEYSTDDNIMLEAEGIIVPNGIKYKYQQK